MNEAADADPVTDRTRGSAWSANLEREVHASDRGLVVEQAIEAVERTEPGVTVNLVTHGDHGHPETYLYDPLSEAFGDHDVEYVGRCRCGGYVTQVSR